MRIAAVDATPDQGDIEALAEIAGIQTAEQALDLVASFYPQQLVPPKVRFGIEEIMQRLATRRHATRGERPPP